jgi:hypothetical protein
MEENDDVQSKGTANYIYFRFYNHIIPCITKKWIGFLVTSIGVFGISWTFIEAAS